VWAGTPRGPLLYPTPSRVALGAWCTPDDPAPSDGAPDAAMAPAQKEAEKSSALERTGMEAHRSHGAPTTSVGSCCSVLLTTLTWLYRRRRSCLCSRIGHRTACEEQQPAVSSVQCVAVSSPTLSCHDDVTSQVWVSLPVRDARLTRRLVVELQGRAINARQRRTRLHGSRRWQASRLGGQQAKALCGCAPFGGIRVQCTVERNERKRGKTA
jgi:hypothetical protein